MNIAECQVSLSLLDISTINQYADIFFQATSAGLKEQEAINFLEKKMKDDPQFTYDETVQVMLNKSIVLPL
jgi:20S proteasome alpha/beta subunit